MSTRAFETIAQLAAARARGATLAETATTTGMFATNKKKKKGQNCQKNEQQRCSNDAAACKPTVLAICQLEPAQCQAVQACCEECSADGFITCLLTVVAA